MTSPLLVHQFYFQYLVFNFDLQVSISFSKACWVLSFSPKTCHGGPARIFVWAQEGNFLIKWSCRGHSPTPNRIALRLNCCFWKNNYQVRFIYLVTYKRLWPCNFLKIRLHHRHFAGNISCFIQEEQAFIGNCIYYFELALNDCISCLILILVFIKRWKIEKLKKDTYLL